MTPDTSRMLLHAYIDGELDAASTIEMESMIAASPVLRQEVECLAALRDALRTRATRFKAPSQLSESLSGVFPSSQAEKISSEVPGWWRTLALGTTAAAAALLLWALGATFVSREARGVGIEEVVSAHVRSLMVDHLTDLASAERHSVKPWLANRLDFAPMVDEFANDGFVLLGARLDYLGGKPAAAIVYRYRQHIINVFVQPAPVNSASSIKLSRHRGYNSATFDSAGMSYWVVSDVNQNDLGQFAKLLQRPSTMK